MVNRDIIPATTWGDVVRTFQRERADYRTFIPHHRWMQHLPHGALDAAFDTANIHERARKERKDKNVDCLLYTSPSPRD